MVKAAVESKLHMSMLQIRDKLAQAGKRIFRNRAAVMAVSAVMTAGVYRCCAALAYLERGYRAYGGECLVALAAGALTYRAISRWARERG